MSAASRINGVFVLNRHPRGSALHDRRILVGDESGDNERSVAFSKGEKVAAEPTDEDALKLQQSRSHSIRVGDDSGGNERSVAFSSGEGVTVGDG